MRPAQLKEWYATSHPEFATADSDAAEFATADSAATESDTAPSAESEAEADTTQTSLRDAPAAEEVDSDAPTAAMALAGSGVATRSAGKGSGTATASLDARDDLRDTNDTSTNGTNTNGTDANGTDGGWRTSAASPEYIRPADAQSGRSNDSKDKPRRGVLIGSILAIVVAVVVVVAVVAVVATSNRHKETPAADQAADAALTYAHALQNGNLTTLRNVTCGDRKRVYDAADDAAFAQQFQTQKQLGQLVEVHGVNAAKVTGSDTAIVEVTASRVSDPAATQDVRMFLHKEEGQWKVCGTR